MRGNRTDGPASGRIAERPVGDPGRSHAGRFTLSMPSGWLRRRGRRRPIVTLDLDVVEIEGQEAAQSSSWTITITRGGPPAVGS